MHRETATLNGQHSTAAPRVVLLDIKGPRERLPPITRRHVRINRHGRKLVHKRVHRHMLNRPAAVVTGKGTNTLAYHLR